MFELVSALYPKEGGPCLGFCCRIVVRREDGTILRECRELFKTEDGAWSHVEKIHGVKREPTFDSPGTNVDANRATETPVPGTKNS